ncbi:hypothetical protein GS917_25190 [Rhodococcus hoagii]|uniref:hypothetical protein n=1 Tax=Rhodococcus hoagii TaxID=43767 RepID=UPI000A0F4AD6|nr:hypothetical protein [Prescottella equi]NKT99800.1 hypothetical protein [Prescottella equi]NKU01743.1 hypothetical protein [Prescottella equi]NKV36717.1 hypothetical protein [Prescottella equi]NKV37945.1 hypothetical protein [Prescottella equi]ORL33096.1 hypothetical protein A6I87_22640 [Prescottella equi]
MTTNADRQTAARVEAAHDEEAEKYAKVHQAARRTQAEFVWEWDQLSDEQRVARVGAMRSVLDQLTADGRLLPESGELTEAVKKSLTDALDTVLSATGLIAPVSDDAPDGTPEKAWPTVWEISEGVWFRPMSMPGVVLSKSGRAGWFLMGDQGGEFTKWSTSDEPINALAPFVRVDGDRS